jgi:UDP-N-acetylglucosamine 2-epimerase
MLALTDGAAVVLTDSGGLQKEAFFLGVPCVTLRDETEWVETLRGGMNILAGAAESDVVSNVALQETRTRTPLQSSAFGDGGAAARIAGILVQFMHDYGRSPGRTS